MPVQALAGPENLSTSFCQPVSITEFRELASRSSIESSCKTSIPDLSKKGKPVRCSESTLFKADKYLQYHLELLPKKNS
tara:strand:+ start:438 stop:674 length:237 start_codon:yes stop_codon:yes gene_type:complete